MNRQSRREPRTLLRTSAMCSFTQSYMPSTQSRQMLLFSGTKRPVCAAGKQWRARCQPQKGRRYAPRRARHNGPCA